jgi:two-component system, NtrC family, nitrogen regulation sensor histidine kinase NtrY
MGRFERKIVAAIAAVGLVPMLATLVLGRAALREAYEVGVNPRVRDQLHAALDMYRGHFVALRQDAERTADAVAFDYRLVAAIRAHDPSRATEQLERALARYGHVAEIALVDERHQPWVSAHHSARMDSRSMRLLRLSRPLGRDGQSVRITFATPAEPFRKYRAAGELVETFTRLEKASSYLSHYYLVVYFALISAVIVLAIAAGVILSRRVTRRVAVLAEATARVGAGDLAVEVPATTKDEIGDLTRAFNAMVRDIRTSRVRIDYLQKIGAWQEFARRLAHEIKNPLTPIQLAVQEINRGYRGDDGRYKKLLDETLSIVEEEIASLRRLVTEFSAFAKLPEAQLSPADLVDFLSEAVAPAARLLSDAEGQPPVDVVCELPHERLPVRIDAMMLKRCLDNLIRNAVEAVRENGPVAGGRVTIRAYRAGSHAVIELRDNGPGVPAHMQAKIFEPYVTTKAEGTGLGLAIVKKIVLEHQGEIAYQPTREGASFVIALPISFA